MLSYIKDLSSAVFGQSPIIFIDTHPEEQDSYLFSYATALKSQLSTAWTGIVPPFLEPGELRIVWWTHDGSEGHKDVPLRAYETVRAQYNELCRLQDVRRVVVVGYAGQNPFAETLEGRLLRGMLEENAREVSRTKRERGRREGEEMGKEGELVDVREMVEGTERLVERERMKEAEARPKAEV